MEKRLTQDVVAALQPAAARYTVADTDKRHLCLAVEVMPTGRRYWRVRRRSNGRRVQVTIGEWPAVTVAAARVAAKQLYAEYAAGRVTSPTATPTVAQFWEVYVDRHLPTLAATSQRAYREAYAVAGPIHHVRLHDLTRGHLARLHVDLTAERGPALADKVRAVIGSLLGRAEEWAYIDQRPRLPKPNGQRKRERWLDQDEVRRLLAVLDEYRQPWADYFLLLLWLGSRPAEVAAMRWADCKLDSRIWMRRQKGGSVVPTHLPGPAVDLLRRRPLHYRNHVAAARGKVWVFPAVRGRAGHIAPSWKAWQDVAAKASLADTCIYTLRHTHASWLAQAGVSLQIIGGQLGHRQTATTERYAHLALAPVAAAVEAMVSDMVG